MSTFLPLNDRLMILPLEEEKPNALIFIPENAKDKPRRGKVIAIPENTMIDNEIVPFNVKIDDIVIFGRFAGVEIELDDTLYLILREGDIFGVLK